MTSLPDWDDNWDEQVNPSSSNQLYHLNTTHRHYIDPYLPNDSSYVSQKDSHYVSQGFVDEKMLLSSSSGDDEDGMPYLRSAGHNFVTGTANVDLRPVASSWTSRRTQDDATMTATNDMDVMRTMNMDAMKRVNFNSYPAPPPPPQATVASKVGISNKHSQIKYNSHPSGNSKGDYRAEPSMMFQEPLSYSSLQHGSNVLRDSSSSSSSSSSYEVDRQQRDRRHHDTAATGSSYSHSRVDLPTFDEFRCREVCLTASNKIKVVHDYLRNVKQHILHERTFTTEVTTYFTACSIVGASLSLIHQICTMNRIHAYSTPNSFYPHPC